MVNTDESHWCILNTEDSHAEYRRANLLGGYQLCRVTTMLSGQHAEYRMANMLGAYYTG